MILFASKNITNLMGAHVWSKEGYGERRRTGPFPLSSICPTILELLMQT